MNDKNHTRIKKARRVMRDAFDEDADFRYSYQANIAMAIYDYLNSEYDDCDIAQVEVADIDECNAAADNVIKLLFESVDDEEDKPVKPTQTFLDGLTFDTVDEAQVALDAEYPGYTIEEKSNGTYIVFDPDHITYAAIWAETVEELTPITKTEKVEAFEGYDSALKDLIE